MSEIQKGDRVRVPALEGVVTFAGVAGYDIALDDGRAAVAIFEAATPLVEKIEPPVEAFGPGDVVRPKKGFDRWPRALGDKGYVRLAGPCSEFYEYGPAGGAYELSEFTSKRFERVELS